MISVALAVYNEEEVLERCLRSIKDLAGEIVIVDGGSTDNTIKIARSFGARIIQTSNPPIFHINKQKALDACKGSWILQLDADEVVTPALADQVFAVSEGRYAPNLSSKQQKLFSRHQANLLGQSEDQAQQALESDKESVSGYFVPRINIFLGGKLKHGGVYPDGVIRLVRKGKASFPCKSVHEQISVDGSVSWLSADLEHYGDPTFSRYLLRSNRYTSLTAQEYKKRGISKSVISLLYYTTVYPVQDFIWRLFRHKAILDGWPGIVFALFSSLHHAIAYMKYLELSLPKKLEQKRTG